MRHRAGTIAVAALWLASCGGGTLGDKSGSGSSGMIAPAGAAGAPGSGASGGVGGLSGRGGWDVGMGGTFFNPCPAPITPVCGSLCGNGRIDECTSQPAPECPITTWREECDRDNQGGDSCWARGYGSGGISCNGDCTRGAASCSPCVPTAPLVASCVGGAQIPSYIAQHVMAATKTEVGILLLQYDGPLGPYLYFTRVAPDWSLLGTTTLGDFRPPGAPDQIIDGMALAPLASGGWIVGVCTQPEVYFLTLDATGEALSRTVVSSPAGGYACSTGMPVLAASPSGGPLMLWQDDKGTMMSLIADDGRSATPARRILNVVNRTGDNGTAAWVGNEFVAALPVEVSPTNGSRSLRLIGVAPDGTTRLVGDFLTGEFDSFASMASGPDAHDVRIIYWGIPPGGDISTDYGLLWWRYDPAADVRPVTIVPPPEFSYGLLPAVAVGDDTFVLAGSVYGDGFVVLRLASDGRVVSPYSHLFRTPPSYGGVAAIAPRGPGVVVSFFDPTRMHLARLTP